MSWSNRIWTIWTSSWTLIPSRKWREIIGTNSNFPAGSQQGEVKHAISFFSWPSFGGSGNLEFSKFMSPRVNCCPPTNEDAFWPLTFACNKSSSSENWPTVHHLKPSLNFRPGWTLLLPRLSKPQWVPGGKENDPPFFLLLSWHAVALFLYLNHIRKRFFIVNCFFLIWHWLYLNLQEFRLV